MKSSDYLKSQAHVLIAFALSAIAIFLGLIAIVLITR